MSEPPKPATPVPDGKTRFFTTRQMAPNDSVMNAALNENRGVARAQLRWLFADQLDGRSEDEQNEVIAAATVLCSFEGNELFRHDLGLSAAETIAAASRAVLSLLATPPNGESVGAAGALGERAEAHAMGGDEY